MQWFSGRSLDKAAEALDLLADSEAAGCWLPGASRKVMGALTKTNVAEKMMRANSWVTGYGDHTQASEGRWGHNLERLMKYGLWAERRPIDFDWFEARARVVKEVEFVREARHYYLDFALLADLVAQLEVTRPLPHVTYVGASPTVTRTLEALGIVAKIDTLRVCPIRWEKVSRRGSDGQKEISYVGYLEWPSGTMHDVSRYAGGSQCHACGHHISNNFNWVPLVVENERGIPLGLWVGRDCAETLLGVKVRGVLELSSTP